MRVAVVKKKSARDGSGYQVCFPQGDAFLTDSFDGKSVEVVWFGVDPGFQGQGIAEAVMRRIHAHFKGRAIIPVNILPGAEVFWKKMAQRGYCQFEAISPA